MVGAERNRHATGALTEGDRVIVKNTLRIKVRADGTRLIIPAPENKRTLKLGFVAYVHKIRGNCYDLRWGQESPDLGLKKDEVVFNVPLTMFIKDHGFY